MSLSKKDLVEIVKEKTEVTNKLANEVVNTLLDTIVETVAKGEKVQIVDFGTFSRRERAARDGRNPQTGEAIKIEATVVPAFKAGVGFKKAVKNHK